MDKRTTDALIEELETLRRHVAQLCAGGPSVPALDCARRLVARIERIEKALTKEDDGPEELKKLLRF